MSRETHVAEEHEHGRTQGANGAADNGDSDLGQSIANAALGIVVMRLDVGLGEMRWRRGLPC